mmetsp:Transcript_26422/g.43263  ORF Transcript_26422/g.43263 Transcript_26422/m.43263 type:complete len:856 (-) Transcript_26422:916-3483(-)
MPSRKRRCPKWDTVMIVALLINAVTSASSPQDLVKKQFKFEKDDVQKATEQLLFYKDKHPFMVPLVINVGLIGFQGGGGHNFSLDAQDLESTLLRNLPVYQPSCLETKEALHIQYQLSYNVVHISQFHVENIERDLKAHLAATLETQTIPDRQKPLQVFEIDALSIDASLEKAYLSHFGYAHGSDNARLQEKMAPYTLFILNPEKSRFAPPILQSMDADESGSTPDFVYRYSYGGSSRTQSWLSKHRFAVVDVSAGPVEFGTMRVGEGTVSANTIPRVEKVVQEERFLAELQKIHEEDKKKTRNLAAAGGGDDAGPSAADLPPTPTSTPLDWNEYEYDHLDSDSYEDYYKNSESDYRFGYDNRKPPPLISNKHKEFLAQLSALSVSAVKYLFVPDTRFDVLELAEKVLVPIIVLRNHQDFDPLQPGTPFYVDVANIEAEIKRLVLPKQEVTVISGTHYLYEHKHVALALARSLRSDSTHETSGKAGRYAVKTRSYLDTASLAYEMTNAADLLAGGLIYATDPSLESTFYNAQIQSQNEDTAQGKKKSKTVGTRVLPVYIFSLLGLEKDVLFDQNSLVYSSHEMVMVLQTDATSIQLPYFSGNKPMEVDPRSSTRHVIAGVASSLGGVLAPYERFSPLHNKRVEDLLWAHGHHPFGPFTNTIGLSEVFVDMALRNSVLSRLNAALRLIKRALSHIEHFANEYVYDPSGEVVSASPNKKSALQRLYRKEGGIQSPLSSTTVDKLHGDLKRMESQFVQCSNHIYSFELEEAHATASSLLINARGLIDYAIPELQKASNEMRCCKIHHEVESQDSEKSPIWVYVAVILFAAGVYAGILGLTAGPKKRTAGFRYRAEKRS